ncbi:MAG: helix-turn-helix transcriptional regulator [Deltaproteobacteria bacterium]|nr:helix-turn-helix transcriptional regulator [Deltaproteobacteria bacterium]
MSRKKCPINENTFGGRLRLFREMEGYKLADFANLLDISHGSLSEIENNKRQLSSRPMGMLVQKTNINIYWLFNGEGKPYILRESLQDTVTASDSLEIELRGPDGKIIEREKDGQILKSSNHPIYKNKSDDFDELLKDASPEVHDLLIGAKKVLTSGNKVAFDALERNIRYFSHAIEAEKRLDESRDSIKDLKEKCDEIIDKVDSLEKRMDKMNLSGGYPPKSRERKAI